MLAELGTPSILKTARMGYDGKGQVRIEKESETKEAWNLSGACKTTNGAILEGFVDFERELSVIAGRGANGDIVSYIPVQNIHKNHILATNGKIHKEMLAFTKPVVESLNG